MDKVWFPGDWSQQLFDVRRGKRAAYRFMTCLLSCQCQAQCAEYAALFLAGTSNSVHVQSMHCFRVAASVTFISGGPGVLLRNVRALHCDREEV